MILEPGTSHLSPLHHFCKYIHAWTKCTRIKKLKESLNDSKFTTMVQTLCVIGASGFLGSHVVAQALEKGFKVGRFTMKTTCNILILIWPHISFEQWWEIPKMPRKLAGSWNFPMLKVRAALVNTYG